MDRSVIRIGARVKCTNTHPASSVRDIEGVIVKVVEPGEVMTEEEVKLYAGEPKDPKKPYGNKPLKIPRLVLSISREGDSDPHYIIAPCGRDMVVEVINFAPSTKVYSGQDMVGEPEELIEIKCPKCGNTDIKLMGFVEEVPVLYRAAEKREGNTLTVDASNNDMDWETARDTMILCRGESTREKGDGNFVYECLNEFPIPDGVEIDWV